MVIVGQSKCGLFAKNLVKELLDLRLVFISAFKCFLPTVESLSGRSDFPRVGGSLSWGAEASEWNVAEYNADIFFGDGIFLVKVEPKKIIDGFLTFSKLDSFYPGG